MSEPITNNGRIAKNTLLLYVRMIFVLIVNLYTSRVVLNVLGVSDYGIYNVVAGFVSLFAFLNATLSSSLQRFYNYEGGRVGEEGFVKVYSLGVRVHFLLAVVVFLLLETLGIWYINNVMVLPADRFEAAHYLFQFSVISMLLVIIQIPFSSVIIACERMSFYAVSSIIEVILRLVIVLILPYFLYDKLLVYGFFQLIVTGVVFLLNVIYAKNKFIFLHLTKGVDQVLLKEILSFSGWNLLGTVVFMLKGQGINLLLNFFFGTIVNAARGVAFQVNSAVMNFSSNISMSFRPQMVSSYAEGNTNRSYNLFLTQSKICYGLTLMIIVPVILEIDLLLHLWLGNAVPDNTSIFTVLVLVDALVCTLNTPVTQIVYATGNIKIYQILTSVVNIFLLPLCWLFLRLGADAWVAFLITIIVSIFNQAISLVAMKRVFQYSYRDYIKRIIEPCFALTLLVPIIPIFISVLMPDSFIRVVIISLTSVIVTVALLYLFFLSPSEKALMQSYLQRVLKRKKALRINE